MHTQTSQCNSLTKTTTQVTVWAHCSSSVLLINELQEPWVRDGHD